MGLVVLGKSLAATGGTMGLLLSLMFGGLLSGRLSVSETVYLFSITIGSLFGVASWFVPKVGVRVQGVVSLIGVALILLGCEGFGFFQASSYPVFLWGSIIAMIGVGAILAVVARKT